MPKDLPLTLENMYLIHSYIYYQKDNSLITDHLYDDICRCLYDNFDKIKTKWPSLFEKDALSAGTGHHICLSEYPPEIIEEAEKDMKCEDYCLVNWRAWFEKESANIGARKISRRKHVSTETTSSV